MTTNIYFIRCGDRVKIGVATNARDRVKSIQVGSAEPVSLLGIMPGGIREERALHHRFHAKRGRGEWFTLDDELADFVSTNARPLPKKPDGRKRSRPDKLVQLNIKVSGDSKDQFEAAYERARNATPSLTKGDFYEILLDTFQGRDGRASQR